MEHIRRIFEARGYSPEEIDIIMTEGSADEIADKLWKLGYDADGKPLATPVPGAQLEIVPETLFDEYTISGSAENTLNLGNYSSAKRGVFVGRKLQVPRDLPEADFCQWLTREIGVAAIPLSAFYGDGFDQKVIRFCFAKKDETLVAALERLASL